MLFKEFEKKKIEFTTFIWAFGKKWTVKFLNKKCWDEIKKLDKNTCGNCFYMDKEIYVLFTSPYVKDNGRMYIDMFLQMTILMHEIGHVNSNKMDLGNIRESEVVPQVYENAYSFIPQVDRIRRELTVFLKSKNIDIKKEKEE